MTDRSHSQQVAQALRKSNPDDLLITVTRSAGDDRAVLVFIDTRFSTVDDPGLRVLVNDDEAYVGKALQYGAHHDAEAVSFQVSLDDIAYTGRELDEGDRINHEED